MSGACAPSTSGQNAARLLAGGELDRFRRGDLCVALADDLGPAADDRALDKTETPERLTADVADKFAGGTRRQLLGKFFSGGFRFDMTQSMP